MKTFNLILCSEDGFNSSSSPSAHLMGWTIVSVIIPPSRRQMSSISVNHDSSLGSMPFLCYALYFSSDSLSTQLCQLLWPWQSGCYHVICDAQHLFAIWVSVFCEWIMFVSVPLNICIQHPCIICQWGCSPGGEDDSYLSVCVCVCVCVIRWCISWGGAAGVSWLPQWWSQSRYPATGSVTTTETNHQQPEEGQSCWSVCYWGWHIFFLYSIS